MIHANKDFKKAIAHLENGGTIQSKKWIEILIDVWIQFQNDACGRFNVSNITYLGDAIEQ